MREGIDLADEAVPFAIALDVGEEIPEELYEAVAEVLTFVYELSEKQKQRDAARLTGKGRGAPPESPGEGGR